MAVSDGNIIHTPLLLSIVKRLISQVCRFTWDTSLGDALRAPTMGHYRSDSSPHPWKRQTSRILDVALTRIRLGPHKLTQQLEGDDRREAENGDGIFAGLSIVDKWNCESKSVACMDWVLDKVVDQSDCGASVGNTKITDLVFADDAVIFAESLEVLVMALEALHEEAKPLGLEVSWLKIKVQVFGDLLDEAVQSVHVCGEDIEILESFTYLGSAVHNDGGSRQEVLRRIGIAHGVMDSLSGSIWRCRYLCRRTKIRIFKSLVIPVLLYGYPVELWDSFKLETAKAAKECIGERPRSRRGFVSTETLEKIEESRAARLAGNQDQHRALSRRTRTLLGRDKERYVRSLAENIEGYLNANDHRPSNRALKKLRSKSPSRASAIRTADGRLISDMDGQMAR
ncbi:hypothetical protein GWK47_048649 [Chionoecetes opilio]|uniref:Reverse transcriptase domain-containing protein n=1 Tax=Chionoecetes opilio TaxID=41210 RepID=A0A8J4YAV1_CHIOP|nr:hypothetical protein GWK47_048649 [Chionoecetes opilio]